VRAIATAAAMATAGTLAVALEERTTARTMAAGMATASNVSH